MPKKPSTVTNVKRNLLDGKVVLFSTVKKQKKKLEAQEAKLAAELKEMIPMYGRVEETPAGHNYVIESGDFVITVSKYTKEQFDQDQAMSLLNKMDEETAEKYLVTTTTKEMMASALVNGDVTPKQLEKCIFKGDEVVSITVKEKS